MVYAANLEGVQHIAANWYLFVLDCQFAMFLDLARLMPQKVDYFKRCEFSAHAVFGKKVVN